MLRRLSRSGYLRSIATLLTGQSLAAVLPILAAPILGRLYMPEDYGVLAAYMSLVAVLGAIGNWQFSQGIIVEAENFNARALLKVCFVTSVITGLLAGVGVLGWAGLREEALSHHVWFYLLPASVFLVGYMAALTATLNRYKSYKWMSGIQICGTVFTVTTSTILGFLGYGYAGLMIGYLAGQVLTFLLSFVAWRKIDTDSHELVDRSAMITSALNHKEFALFTTPSEFVTYFTLHIPVYALTLLGDLGLIGLFNRARQLVTMPISLLAGSTARVFQQQAAEDVAKTGNCRELYLKTMVGLAALGFLPVLVLFLFAHDIFALLLGENWRDAGDVVRVIAPMLYLRLIVSPISTVFYVSGAQKEDFTLTLILSVLTCILVATAILLDAGSMRVIVAFSVGYGMIYVVYLIRGFQLSGKPGHA